MLGRQVFLVCHSPRQSGRARSSIQSAALVAVPQAGMVHPEMTSHRPQDWMLCRQGEMARWVSGVGKWRDTHCVLTRAGFLHCLADMGEALPEDTIALGHAAFITGDAPEFQLIEELPARVAVFSKQRGASTR